jgi:hypothetical protein
MISAARWWFDRASPSGQDLSGAPGGGAFLPSLLSQLRQSHDAAVIGRQSWPADTDLLVLDEIHKMSGWKAF